MMIKRIIPALCLLCVLSGALWAQNDGRGRRGDAFSRLPGLSAAAEEDEFSPLDEYTIGRAVGATVLGRFGVYSENPALTEYLNKICEAIVVNSPNPVLFNGYHVLILNSTLINAFATSGGHIFITRGLIAYANSEDILAAVIAHEIAHIQLKHSVTAMQDTRLVQDLRNLGNESARRAAQIQGTDPRRIAFEESLKKAVDIMLDAGYSHEQEYQADAFAITLLTRAGYQPSSLVDMLQILQDRRGSNAGGVYSTHPSPQSRIENANQILQSTRGPPDNRAERRNRFQATGR
jgi:predicted Zn-dependent protease